MLNDNFKIILAQFHITITTITVCSPSDIQLIFSFTALTVNQNSFKTNCLVNEQLMACRTIGGGGNYTDAHRRANLQIKTNGLKKLRLY